MNNDATLKNPSEIAARLKWIGFILMASGSLSFSNKILLGDIVALSGAIIFLGSCIWAKLERKI